MGAGTSAHPDNAKDTRKWRVTKVRAWAPPIHTDLGFSSTSKKTQVFVFFGGKRGSQRGRLRSPFAPAPIWHVRLSDVDGRCAGYCICCARRRTCTSPDLATLLTELSLSPPSSSRRTNSRTRARTHPPAPNPCSFCQRLQR